MAEQNLNWYTRTYPNFLDDELCDAYVQMFEETLEKDAEEVKNDINNWGKECEIKKMDILLDDISCLDLSYFNQVYYFASPKIRENRSNIFNQSLYMNYRQYYVHGLTKLAKVPVLVS